MHNAEKHFSLRVFTQLTCAATNPFLSQLIYQCISSSRFREYDVLEGNTLACFFLDLTQDVEERRLHSVAVERMFSETQHKAAVKL